MRAQQSLFTEALAPVARQRSLFPLAEAKSPAVAETYSRQEAIKDGLLIALSGPDFDGNPMLEYFVQQAGWPSLQICVTEAVWNELIDLHPQAEHAGHDLAGRLTDLLLTTKRACRASMLDTVTFEVAAVLPTSSPRRLRKRGVDATPVAVKCVKSSTGDNGLACLTIMFPHED
jgi:hypothetical protein